jgi:hypothetical protein
MLVNAHVGSAPDWRVSRAVGSEVVELGGVVAEQCQ